MAASDLQKAANRMAFGEQEKEVENFMGESIGLGMIGGSTGKLKLAHKDFKGSILHNNFLAPVSKKHKNMMNFQSSNNPNSGLASSVAFTPIKGIELHNPESKKEEDKSNKYFGSSAFKAPLPNK